MTVQQGTVDAAAAATAAAEAAQAAVARAEETESAKDLKAAQIAIAALQDKVKWLETEAKKNPSISDPSQATKEIRETLAEAKSLLAELKETITAMKPSTLNVPPLNYASASAPSGANPPADPPPILAPHTDDTPTEPRASGDNTRRVDHAPNERGKKKIRLL